MAFIAVGGQIALLLVPMKEFLYENPHTLLLLSGWVWAGPRALLAEHAAFTGSIHFITAAINDYLPVKWLAQRVYSIVKALGLLYTALRIGSSSGIIGVVMDQVEIGPLAVSCADIEFNIVAWDYY